MTRMTPELLHWMQRNWKRRCLTCGGLGTIPSDEPYRQMASEPCPACANPEPLTTLDRHAQLKLHPHYSDDRFRKERTVFGHEPTDSFGHKGLTYNYSDRLVQWDATKHGAAWSKAQESKAPRDSALFLEAYLSAYYSKPIEVVHVVAGVNHSNGYPYWVVGWREAVAK